MSSKDWGYKKFGQSTMDSLVNPSLYSLVIYKSKLLETVFSKFNESQEIREIKDKRVKISDLDVLKQEISDYSGLTLSEFKSKKLFWANSAGMSSSDYRAYQKATADTLIELIRKFIATAPDTPASLKHDITFALLSFSNFRVSLEKFENTLTVVLNGTELRSFIRREGLEPNFIKENDLMVLYKNEKIVYVGFVTSLSFFQGYGEINRITVELSSLSKILQLSKIISSRALANVYKEARGADAPINALTNLWAGWDPRDILCSILHDLFGVPRVLEPIKDKGFFYTITLAQYKDAMRQVPEEEGKGLYISQNFTLAHTISYLLAVLISDTAKVAIRAGAVAGVAVPDIFLAKFLVKDEAMLKNWNAYLAMVRTSWTLWYSQLDPPAKIFDDLRTATLLEFYEDRPCTLICKLPEYNEFVRIVPKPERVAGVGVAGVAGVADGRIAGEGAEIVVGERVPLMVAGPEPPAGTSVGQSIFTWDGGYVEGKYVITPDKILAFDLNKNDTELVARNDVQFQVPFLGTLSEILGGNYTNFSILTKYGFRTPGVTTNPNVRSEVMANLFAAILTGINNFRTRTLSISVTDEEEYELGKLYCFPHLTWEGIDERPSISFRVYDKQGERLTRTFMFEGMVGYLVSKDVTYTYGQVGTQKLVFTFLRNCEIAAEIKSGEILNFSNRNKVVEVRFDPIPNIADLVAIHERLEQALDRERAVREADKKRPMAGDIAPAVEYHGYYYAVPPIFYHGARFHKMEEDQMMRVSRATMPFDPHNIYEKNEYLKEGNFYDRRISERLPRLLREGDDHVMFKAFPTRHFTKWPSQELVNRLFQMQYVVQNFLHDGINTHLGNLLYNFTLIGHCLLFGRDETGSTFHGVHNPTEAFLLRDPPTEHFIRWASDFIEARLLPEDGLVRMVYNIWRLLNPAQILKRELFPGQEELMRQRDDALARNPYTLDWKYAFEKKLGVPIQWDAGQREALGSFVLEVADVQDNKRLSTTVREKDRVSFRNINIDDIKQVVFEKTFSNSYISFDDVFHYHIQRNLNPSCRDSEAFFKNTFIKEKGREAYREHVAKDPVKFGLGVVINLAPLYTYGLKELLSKFRYTITMEGGGEPTYTFTLFDYYATKYPGAKLENMDINFKDTLYMPGLSMGRAMTQLFTQGGPFVNTISPLQAKIANKFLKFIKNRKEKDKLVIIEQVVLLKMYERINVGDLSAGIASFEEAIRKMITVGFRVDENVVRSISLGISNTLLMGETRDGSAIDRLLYTIGLGFPEYKKGELFSAYWGRLDYTPYVIKEVAGEKPLVLRSTTTS